MIRGLKTFFDSSERRLKTNPVDRICSIPAAITVDKIHIIDTEETEKEENGIPFVILVRTAIPTNKLPMPNPNNISDILFLIERPTPFRNDCFSVFVINQYKGKRKTSGFAKNSSNHMGNVVLNVARYKLQRIRTIAHTLSILCV
jgi:hypothetical protein